MPGKRRTAAQPPKLHGPAAFAVVFLGGVVCGLALGAVGGLIGAALLQEEFFFGALIGGMTGLIIGYPVGAAIGFIIVRKLWRLRGSFLLGMLGCLVGALGTAVPAEPLKINAQAMLIAYGMVVPVLGTVGFFLGRGKGVAARSNLR